MSGGEMSILFIILNAVVIFILAYYFYGSFLAKKVYQLDDTHTTPATEIDDKVDYVPIEPKFLMGQHFSAIAAAGPVTGPILAGILFGWVPALIWIILGSIFIGGVHDMGALIASVRHKARSITEVVKENVSSRAYILFMIFIWITLVYIIVAFTDITASSFVGSITLENGEKVSGGAIATSSMLYLLFPVIMGLLLKFTRLSLFYATLIFLPLIAFAIWVGQYIPFNLDQFLGISTSASHKLWDVGILVYCFIASILPMWMLLQPRGHLGGYFLYASLLVAAIGIIFGGFTVKFPAFIIPEGSTSASLFPMFPLLFITIACGACSGFHALVSSGTTSKQLKKESDAKIIGYGAMLLEGLVAIIALACVMILTKDNPNISKAPNFIFASGIGSFLELIHLPAALGVSFGLMAFTTFVYDTLDVCTRLGRYIIEELTGWKKWFGKAFATALTAGVPLMFVMQKILDAKGNEIPAWKVFWGIFGAANQLLAALALIGISVWLLNSNRKKMWLVTFLPAVWMFIMSNWALINLISSGWYKAGVFNLTLAPVPIVSLVLMVLSLWMAYETYIAVAGKAKKISV